MGICQSPPWDLLYAKDLALIGETAQDVQTMLNAWDEVLTANGLKINEKKTEYMAVNEEPATIYLHNQALATVYSFK